MHLEPVHKSTSTHSCKNYAKHRAANLSFSYEYFYLLLHSQWWLEATSNSLLFSSIPSFFRRTEHSITEKNSLKEICMYQICYLSEAATLHREHNERHRALASTQSSLQIKAPVNFKTHHRSGEVIVSNRGKNIFFPSHQKQLTVAHERRQAANSFSTTSNISSTHLHTLKVL